jgi:RNA polymerase sigma-70 factor (ECF subfamily)
MPAETQSSVSTLLGDLRDGDPEARSHLLQKVYNELRRIAAKFLRGHGAGFSLQPTDVVDEAYIRLFGKDFRPENRCHFFGAAAKAIRDVVVEHARKRATQKHGGGARRVPLDEVAERFERQNLVVQDVRDALDRLATIRPRQSTVITMRCFFLYTIQETAELLGISEKTVRNDERFAKAWLHSKLAETTS